VKITWWDLGRRLTLEGWEQTPVTREGERSFWMTRSPIIIPHSDERGNPDDTLKHGHTLPHPVFPDSAGREPWISMEMVHFTLTVVGSGIES
jgi:hypothetical protein